MYRSKAIGRKAVHLIQGQYLEYTFCVRKETKVQVSNIRLSNDSLHDEYVIEIDGNVFGYFQTGTQTGSGAAWNDNHSSGQVGQPVDLGAGGHKVKLTTVFSDQRGDEVDFITLDVDDRNLDEMGFYCDKFSSDDIAFKTCLHRTAAHIVQDLSKTVSSLLVLRNPTLELLCLAI